MSQRDDELRDVAPVEKAIRVFGVDGKELSASDMKRLAVVLEAQPDVLSPRRDELTIEQRQALARLATGLAADGTPDGASLDVVGDWLATPFDRVIRKLKSGNTAYGIAVAFIRPV